jgi:hypothetical protein
MLFKRERKMSRMGPCAIFLPQPSDVSFAEAMSRLRLWFDHKKIQPTAFQLIRGDEVGFEIRFRSEGDTSAFDVGFAWHVPADVGATPANGASETANL